MKTKSATKARENQHQKLRNTRKNEKYVAEVSCHKRRKTTMLHVSLTPQHDAGQLDFGRIKVFVMFSTHVIEN